MKSYKSKGHNMTEKQIYDITEEDLNKSPIWHFPMDETVYDEQTIRPYEEDTTYSLFKERLIIRTKFTYINDKQYNGYIYWATPETIGGLQPTLFLNEGICVSFWEGLNKPTWDNYGVHSAMVKSCFPIKFKSQEFPGISSIEGTLEGLYYIDTEDKTTCVKP